MNQQPYKKLYTYWFSVIIYDHTVKFCEEWIGQSWKLKEQMTGAARSGKQNIRPLRKLASLRNLLVLSKIY